jgi:hypothetical protein
LGAKRSARQREIQQDQSTAVLAKVPKITKGKMSMTIKIPPFQLFGYLNRAHVRRPSQVGIPED